MLAISMQQKVLLLGALYFIVLLWKGHRLQAHYGRIDKSTPVLKVALIGALANFGDTLGLGSFTTKSFCYRQFSLVDDRWLPGTLNAQCVLPCIAQALVFHSLVQVDVLTLVAICAASAFGARLSCKHIARLNKQSVRWYMSGALLFIASLLLMLKLFGISFSGHGAMSLQGSALGLAIIMNLILGLLMPMGVGSYALNVFIFILLGLDPLAAFAVVSSSAALVTLLSSRTFIREGLFDVRAVLAVCITGPIAAASAIYLLVKFNVFMSPWFVLVLMLASAYQLYRRWQDTETLRHGYCAEREPLST